MVFIRKDYASIQNLEIIFMRTLKLSSEIGSKGDTANSHGAFNFDDADDVDKVSETELDDPLEQNENPSEDPFGIYSILNKIKDNDANIPVSDQ
ncbi:hypothetical protein Tco_0236504 [Tanacetum coccineum]